MELEADTQSVRIRVIRGWLPSVAHFEEPGSVFHSTRGDVMTDFTLLWLLVLSFLAWRDPRFFVWYCPWFLTWYCLRSLTWCYPRFLSWNYPRCFAVRIAPNHLSMLHPRPIGIEPHPNPVIVSQDESWRTSPS